MSFHGRRSTEIRLFLWSHRASGHSLVIARPTQIGTVSAAQCAATVNQRFPNVRFALMVGIGAGIPNPPSRDIRLGDIAVSIPQHNHPGVIQYDFGKYEGDSFVLKVPLNKPPSILISADGSLEEEEMMSRSPLRKILRSITKKPGFKRPDTGDYLFKEDFNHIEKGRDCTECLASGTAKFVLRDMRRRKDPVVYRGLMLSGSGVIKKPQDRYRLCRDYIMRFVSRWRLPALWMRFLAWSSEEYVIMQIPISRMSGITSLQRLQPPIVKLCFASLISDL